VSAPPPIEPTVIEMNSKRFVVGLHWKTFYYETASQKNRKLRIEKQSLNHPSGVFIDGKGLCAIGLDNQIRKGQHLSLALLLAKTYGNSVHVHNIGDDNFWLCWIKNGVPVASGEKFFNSHDQVKQYILDHVLQLTGTTEYYGDRRLVPPIVANNFTDHDLNTTIVSLNEKDRSSRIRNLYMSLRAKIVSLSIAAIVGVSALGYYVHHNDLISAERAQSILERKADKLKKKLEKSKNVFYSTLYSYGNRPLPEAWIKSVISTVGVYPEYYKGWTLNAITCLGESNLCSINFISTHNGTNANFVKRFKKHKIDFHPSGKAVLIEMPIPLLDSANVDGESFYNKLPKKPYFYTETLSTIQYLQASEVFRYSVGDSADSLSTSLDSAIKDGKPIASDEIGVTIREWELKGSGLFHLAEISKELPSNSFIIDRLEITYETRKNTETKANWKMEGRYAHKS
jgi:hypothetical protein